MSTEFYIDKKWQKLFNENELKEFTDFFKDRKDLALLAEEKSTSVLKLSLHGNNFFLKRKFPESLSKIFRYILKGKGFRNLVKQEITNLNHLEKHGFRVMKVAAWGVQTVLGHPQSSFILSEEVIGEDFQELYDRSGPKQRRLQYQNLGNLCAKLHNKKMDTFARPQDVYCHIDEETDEVIMTLIDREEGSTKLIDYNEKKICMDLAKIFYKFVKRYERMTLNIKDILYFCKSYSEESEIINLKTREFYTTLVRNLLEFMPTRKSHKFVENLLTQELLITR